MLFMTVVAQADFEIRSDNLLAAAESEGRICLMSFNEDVNPEKDQAFPVIHLVYLFTEATASRTDFAMPFDGYALPIARLVK